MAKIEAIDADAHEAIMLNTEGHVSDVDAMDSLGIGDLVGAYTIVSRRGGALKLLRPSRKIKLLMEITALDQLFEVFSEEGDALGSFLS